MGCTKEPLDWDSLQRMQTHSNILHHTWMYYFGGLWGKCFLGAAIPPSGHCANLDLGYIRYTSTSLTNIV